jgi:L-alanine-DL-glutamate epimerase-like enolase superfamily enzyme
MRRREFLKLAGATGASLFAGRLNVSPLPGETSDRPQASGDLSAHRIASISARQVQDRYPRAVGPNAQGSPVGSGGGYQVRVITTDQGARGWAMCQAKDDEVQKFVGARVSDFFDPEKGASEDAFPLDVVLHDLGGNILGKPVWAMLGGAGPREVPIYSGAIYLDDLMPQDNPRGVEGLLSFCRQDYNAGYRAFKLKVGRGAKWMPREVGLARDIEVTRAVHEQFPDCRVLADANDAYSVDEAIAYVRGVADCDLYWLEEPFEESRDGLLRLHEAMAAVGCKALIADGEARKSRPPAPAAYGGYTTEFVENLYALAAEKLVQVFLFDLGIVGYTRWRRIMPELIKAGVLASPHTWMWTPRPYYASQLVAGLGNVAMVEGIPGRAAGIDYSAYRFNDGKLVMPEEPGFGLRLAGQEG